jgi:ligand-binding sensor domain-containing protein/two-component sensor histidine kinase
VDFLEPQSNYSSLRLTGKILRCLWGCALLFAIAINPSYGLDPTQHISQYAHASWLVQDGPLVGEIQTMAQTLDGYLWIGTGAGLFHFDGVRFVKFSASDGSRLGSDNITSLLAARDGSLWIGTQRGLHHFADHRLTANPSVHRFISASLEDRAGTLWITQRGSDGSGSLCRIVSGTTQCYGEQDGLPSENDCCNALAEDGVGNLWVGASTMLLRWRPWKQFPIAGLQPIEVGVSSLANTRDGAMWVGMALHGRGLGLQRMLGENWSPALAQELDGSSLTVLALFTDRDGALWVGTARQGIFRIAGNKLDHFDSRDGLSSNWVSQFYQDREGTLWIATGKGLDSFREISVTTVSPQGDRGADWVSSVMAARDGTVWVGTSDSLEAHRPNAVSIFRPEHGLPGKPVKTLFDDRSGRLWVGINDGLWIYSSGKFLPINKPDGRPTGMVLGMTDDSDNNVWVEVIGPPRALLRIRDSRVQETLGLPQFPSANKIAADPISGIWLGLRNGDIARYRNGVLETIVTQGSHRSSPVLQIAVTADGAVLAATGFGLIRWHAGREQILTTRNGLPCDTVNGFLEDDDHNLWLYTQCGLVNVAGAELERWWADPARIVSLHTLSSFDGVRVPRQDQSTSTAKSSDGRLWFAGGRVLQVLDPKHLTVNSVVPTVHIEQIIADRKIYLPQQHLRLRPLTRDVEIQYTATSFVVPQKVRFRYQLLGYDSDWRDADTRRQAFYGNLRPGKYQFRVLACNNDDVWNTVGASQDFDIPPMFYQTRWFLVLSLVAGLVVLYLLYIARLRQLAFRIRDRLIAKNTERERIARELHDTLLQSTQGLVLQLHAATKHLPADNPARAEMDAALQRANEVISEGRDRVQDLRIAHIVSIDIATALASVGEDLAREYHLEFRAVVDGDPRVLDPIVREEAYAIGREALLNACMHAQARLVEAQIIYSDADFRLRVRDDGKGIGENALRNPGRPGHWGMRGMHERAQKIGAQLEIWSRQNAGAEMELTVPAALAYKQRARRFGWFKAWGAAGP